MAITGFRVLGFWCPGLNLALVFFNVWIKYQYYRLFDLNLYFLIRVCTIWVVSHNIIQHLLLVQWAPGIRQSDAWRDEQGESTLWVSACYIPSGHQVRSEYSIMLSRAYHVTWGMHIWRWIHIWLATLKESLFIAIIRCDFAIATYGKKILNEIISIVNRRFLITHCPKSHPKIHNNAMCDIEYSPYSN